MSLPTDYKGASASTCKVLMLLTNTYDPDPRVRQQALTLLRMGCAVRIIGWDRDLKSPATQNMEGVEIERIHLSSLHGRGTSQLFYYVLLYFRFFWRGMRTRFDVLHCHDLDTLPVGFLIARLKGKPLIYDSHESYMDMLSGSINSKVRNAIFHLENFLIRRVDLLITVGEKLRRAFEARGAKHTAVVGNWKSLDEYRKTEQQNRELRERLGIPQDAIVITCITQLLRNRMVEELIDAAKPFEDVYVIIAGKGELEGKVRQAAKESSRVVFPGFVHASEVPAYTCASDVIYCGFDPLNPNAKYAAPNKLFEALAGGKPLISPDIGEIGDLIRRFDCGVVIPDCSAGEIAKAITVLRDRERLAFFTANARSLGAREMNWERGREVLAVEYSRLCSKLKPAPPKPAAVGSMGADVARES